MAGWKVGETLFYRILPATARGLLSKTAVEWHLKVKHKVKCLSNQILLHHSQHAKNKLNS